MQKFFLSVINMVLQPIRTLEIINIYKKLNGRYRLTIILAHSFKEVIYRKKFAAKKSNKNSAQNVDIKDTRQVIINIHNGLLHSGGLTDRLKGMCTLYMFSKKENYKFQIFFNSPFNLEKYLLPNVYDWTVSENILSYNLKTTAIYIWENELLARNFFQLNKDKEQLHIDCNSGECFQNYSELFHELFKPSLLLTTELKLHTQRLGGYGNYISITLRFQNLMGEFKEGKSTSLDEKECSMLINNCLVGINEIKMKYKNIDKILITSDSNIFREIAANSYSYIYTYVLPEETGHIDYADAGKGKEFTAFLDMFLIAKAKKAYQIKSSVMYNSDFPSMAAKINDVPYELILI